MNQYQKRVQVSLERLSIPTWYKSSGTSSQTPTQQVATRSISSPTGWRRHLPQPQAHSNNTKNQDISLKLSWSQRQSRMPKARPVNPSPRVPYLGWRQEYVKEKLYSGPAQRLARSLTGLDKVHREARAEEQ